MWLALILFFLIYFFPVISFEEGEVAIDMQDYNYDPPPHTLSNTPLLLATGQNGDGTEVLFGQRPELGKVIQTYV